MLNLKDKLILVNSTPECYRAYRNLTVGKKYDISKVMENNCDSNLVCVIDDLGVERKFLFKKGYISSFSGCAELVDKYDAPLATYGEDKETGGFSVKFDPEFAQLMKYEVESVIRAMMEPGGFIYNFTKRSYDSSEVERVKTGTSVSKVEEKVDEKVGFKLDGNPVIDVSNVSVGVNGYVNGCVKALEELREILRVPDGEDIRTHAKAIRSMADALLKMINQ